MEAAPHGVAGPGLNVRTIPPNRMKTISFRDNVANRHGEVYRSSAIFFVPRTDRVRTTISFLNYWALKRELQVAVVASTRTMSGALVGRERLKFEAGQVVNYRPPLPEGQDGSVEIEVFAADNMVIPYAAVVAWYETECGVSIVHSYARAYSPHEIEDGRTISRGREGCWTIADDTATRSFCVFHNGSGAVPEQPVRLAVTNAAGERKHVQWQLPALAPYQSVSVEPAERIADLGAFLQGRPGQAEIEFELGGGFSRMLVGSRRNDWSDLQVTHSNFNYTLQPTDMAGPGAAGWMEVPPLGTAKTELVVYPQSVEGRYRLDRVGNPIEFRTGEQVIVPVEGPQTLRFEAVAGELPTRLVTGLRVGDDANRLPNECSLGILTSLQPPKRLWWGPLRLDGGASSRLVVHDLPQIYQGIAADAVLSFRLFSASSQAPLETQRPAGDLGLLHAGVPVEDLWPQAREFLAGAPGYYTMFCPYGGLTVYTLTRNAHGSVCLEHGF